MELVASVVDRDTRDILSTHPRPLSDAVIPLMRSSRVVRALEREMMLPVSISTMTESVYVPPVSMPSPYAMQRGMCRVR